jgi:hypothetical protein
MHMPSANWAFNAEDQKVYWDWLRGTLAVYSVVAVSAIMTVAFLATANVPNIDQFLTTAVVLASP